jgi:hypothetical protein
MDLGAVKSQAVEKPSTKSNRFEKLFGRQN